MDRIFVSRDYHFKAQTTYEVNMWGSSNSNEAKMFK